MRYTLDASAVIAYLRGEPGSDRVEAVLAGLSGKVIHAVNLLEVNYKLVSFGGETAAGEALADHVSLGIQTYETLDTKLLHRSAFFKVRYPFLSLADSICIATAEQCRSTVLTSDRPFSNVGDGVLIEMIR